MTKQWLCILKISFRPRISLGPVVVTGIIMDLTKEFGQIQICFTFQVNGFHRYLELCSLSQIKNPDTGEMEDCHENIAANGRTMECIEKRWHGGRKV